MSSDYVDPNLANLANLANLELKHNFYPPPESWFKRICQSVVQDMNQHGICVIDNFLGQQKGTSILDEVKKIYNIGLFSGGQVVNNKGKGPTVRGDQVVWVNGTDSGTEQIGFLIQTLDTIIDRCNRLKTNVQHSHLYIGKRTPAMVACYPGGGSRYVKHVDNPNEDGRVITCLYYLNQGWDLQQHGGLLRIYPILSNHVADIAPYFDRVIFFWSDRRNPHEVLL